MQASQSVGREEGEEDVNGCCSVCYSSSGMARRGGIGGALLRLAQP